MDEGLENLKYVLEIVAKLHGSARKRHDLNGIVEDSNYKTLFGSLEQISRTLACHSDPEFFWTDVETIIKRGRDIHFPILPELNERGVPLCTSVIEIEPHKTHFMVRAFEYQEMLKKRHLNCVKTCIVLLRVAPFQQKDLRLWWVRNMVLPTWHNQVWEKNAGVLEK